MRVLLFYTVKKKRRPSPGLWPPSPTHAGEGSDDGGRGEILQSLLPATGEGAAKRRMRVLLFYTVKKKRRPSPGLWPPSPAHAGEGSDDVTLDTILQSLLP